jgi:EAL domain-containing protein (putative c-di-GMP-specific phosphodiesterase class I)
MKNLKDKNIEGTVSINVTGSDLVDADLISTICRAIESNQIDPNRIIIEVSEVKLVSDFDKMSKIIASLDSMGIRTCLDKFSIDQLDLFYSKKLPFSEVKIDQHTLNHYINTGRFLDVSESILLAKKYGCQITIEKIDDLKTLEFAKRIGSDNVQGYIIDNPLPISDFNKVRK